MADTNLIRKLTKRCEYCRGRINIERAENDDYIEITRKREGAKSVGTSIYYHTDCAPLGNTSIPEKLGVDN